MGDGEYWGGVELPYSDLAHQDASGKLYVAVESPSTDHATTTLHVFAQHIRADQNSRELRLYLDLQRLERAPAGMDDEDRMIGLSLTGDVEVRAVSWFGASSNWYTVDDPSFDAKLGVCGPDGIPGGTTDTSKIYCDAEFQVELTNDQIYQVLPAAPGPSPIVGMAFATYSVSGGELNDPSNIPALVPYFSGALPETFVDHLADDTDRTQQMSLVFAQPNGVPIKFLSWNLAHWGTWYEWLLNSGSPFKHVDLSDMAAIMKDYDVVAVQEMWSTHDARRLLDEINARRPADKQMTMTRPIDIPSSVLTRVKDSLFANYADLFTSLLADTQGGVFIYSRFPVVESNHIIYSDCRGEDCFKAKGALHVRLALRPPGSGSESLEACSGSQGAPPGRGCPADPTGEMYVDVYDTHIQAGGKSLCTTGTIKSFLGELAFQALDGTATAFHPGNRGQLNCGVDPAEVHASQYRQLADFVARTSTDPNRTILAGDFNTNGRRIGPVDPDAPDADHASANLHQYETLLHTLGVYEASRTWPSGPAHIDGVQDDTINLHPGVFPWDIDHGDIAREEDATYDWRRCGVGTQSGTGGDTACRLTDPGSRTSVPSYDEDTHVCSEGSASCPHHACDLWNNGRLDYIFVGAFPRAVYYADPIGDHPPAPPGPSARPRPTHPSYLLGRGPLDEPVWRRLQPIQSGAAYTCGRASDGSLTLLSDHAPIAGNLMLFPMRQPAVFHPQWDHAVEVRVTSTDVTGTSDCIGGICGATEVYFDISGRRTKVGDDDGSVWPRLLPFTTNWCHGWTLPNDDANCMLTWGVWRHVTAEDTLTDDIDFKMRENDSFRDDHFSITDPGSDPSFRFNWRRSYFQIDNQDGDFLNGWPGPVSIRNTDPVRIGLSGTALDLPPDLGGAVSGLFSPTSPFAGFVIYFHEEDASRPRAVAP